MVAGTRAYASDNNDGLIIAKRRSEDSSHRVGQRRLATTANAKLVRNKKRTHERAKKRSRKDRSPGGVCAPLLHGLSFSVGCRFCCSAANGPVVKSAYTLEKRKG